MTIFRAEDCCFRLQPFASARRASQTSVMLEAKTPASAWKPGRGGEGVELVVDDPKETVEDDVGASMVKGRCEDLKTRTNETETPGSAPVDTDEPREPPRSVDTGDDGDVWWGEDLVATADSDEEDFVAGGLGKSLFHKTKTDVGAYDTAKSKQAPFSAARTSRGRLAGNTTTRCFVCGGEHIRNEMVLLSKCCHPLCQECATGWAQKRGQHCPTCKEEFDGWHYGKFDHDSKRWYKSFHKLEVIPDDDDDDERTKQKRDEKNKTQNARSRRALAFDAVGVVDALSTSEAKKYDLFHSSEKKRKGRFETGEGEIGTVDPVNPDPLIPLALHESEEDELLENMRSEGGASFQTPVAKKSRTS